MSRKQVIDIASLENGTKEAPPNSNKTKYGEWYGLNGVPWCAIFVSWVFHKAGHPLGKVDTPKGYQYCPSAFNFWKRTNRLTSSPQMGDIVLYDWNGDGTCDHTGIFVQWIDSGKTFSAWEGNTSFNNDSDGGQVMLRTRQVRTVKAFVNPDAYGETVQSRPVIIQKGDQSADVTRIQKMLYDLKFNITVDGDFGPATELMVKQFQQQHGLTPSGIVDEITTGALEAALAKPKLVDRKTVTGTYLKKGDAGAAVIALQKALNAKGVKVTEDGVFGNKTVAALKTFQKRNRLVIDGIAGPQTWKMLGVKNI